MKKKRKRIGEMCGGVSERNEEKGDMESWRKK